MSSGIVISREIFSNYVVDEVDVGKKIGLPVLGVIPQVEEIFITCVALIADILTSSANYALETVNPRLLITLFKTILLFMMIA